MTALVPSSSTYSFRSICPSTFNTAGQYPSQELLAPAVVLTSAESPSNSTWNKLKKFAGKARKNKLSKSTSHADLLQPTSPACSLARSTNTLSHYPLRSSFDNSRSLTMSPPRRAARQAFGSAAMMKSPSTQSKISIRADIQEFASSLFAEDVPTTPTTDMGRQWSLRGEDVYPSSTPRSRSSSFNHTPGASTTSSARSSFSGGPATPPESYLLPFWAQEEKEKVTLTMGMAKRPVSPTVVHSGWLAPVALDGIWCLQEEDDAVLQRELKRVMGVAI